MIKVENIDVWGFEHSIRGMRNPYNSWDRSDSEYKYPCNSLGVNETPHYCTMCGFDQCDPFKNDPVFVVGPNDLDLMRRLYKLSVQTNKPAHRKYMRQIFVSMDITAPLYWWKEMDQYKVGTVTDSCSTMHTIHSKEFELDDFSHEHLTEHSKDILSLLIGDLNVYRNVYLETKNKNEWWQMIQLLPSSYNQKRTLTMNYENVVAIINQRSGHRLDEWNDFVELLKQLPYFKEITDGCEVGCLD